MSELKPCPYCGCTEIIKNEFKVGPVPIPGSQEKRTIVMFNIICNNCYLHGPTSMYQKIAIDAWNSLPRNEEEKQAENEAAKECQDNLLDYAMVSPQELEQLENAAKKADYGYWLCTEDTVITTTSLHHEQNIQQKTLTAHIKIVTNKHIDRNTMSEYITCANVRRILSMIKELKALREFAEDFKAQQKNTLNNPYWMD